MMPNPLPPNTSRPAALLPGHEDQEDERAYPWAMLDRVDLTAPARPIADGDYTSFLVARWLRIDQDGPAWTD